MIKRILDYYYVVVSRGFGMTLPYQITGLMSATLAFNLLALGILFFSRIFDSFYSWIGFIIVNITINAVFNAIYNKKRREELKERYRKEPRESRQRGAAWVIGYEILSIGLIVWAFSRIVPT